jgi:NADH dehydrogenase
MSGIPHIVIIGAGFGGVYCAKELQKRLKASQVRITLVDPRNYLTFYPLLIEAGTGGLEPRHAVVPVRRFLKFASFLMAKTTAVDLEKQQVICQTMLQENFTLDYDHLVIALGAVPRHPDLPGLSEYGFAIKSMADAAALRDRAVAMLELADGLPSVAKRHNLLSFLVVGGNYTGVEVAGEFNAYLKAGARHYPRLKPDDIQMTLVDRNDRILNTLDKELSDYAMKRLHKHGVNILLNRSVTSISEDHAVLDNGDVVNTSTVIWAAGIAPHPLVAHTGLPVNDHGYIPCDPDLRVTGCKNVWGVGDIADNPDPTGKAYPPTAQHAVREGVQAGRNIASAILGKPTRPLVYKTRGMIAPLGHFDGVARVGNMNLSGFLAWFLWRTYYVFKVPGLAYKVRVIADWSLGVIFSREYVQLGVHGKHRAEPRIGLSSEENTATAEVTARQTTVQAPTD